RCRPRTPPSSCASRRRSRSSRSAKRRSAHPCRPGRSASPPRAAVRTETAEMSPASRTVPADVDDALAEFQGHLNLIFARARTLWKESAARIHPELQRSGYKLLTFIAHAGSANAHVLADRFEMDKSVVSRQVRMLEDHGLLESRPDDTDGRQ